MADQDDINKIINEAFSSFIGNKELLPRKVCDCPGGELWVYPIEGPGQFQPVLRLKEPLTYIRYEFVINPAKDSTENG